MQVEQALADLQLCQDGQLSHAKEEASVPAQENRRKCTAWPQSGRIACSVLCSICNAQHLLTFPRFGLQAEDEDETTSSTASASLKTESPAADADDGGFKVPAPRVKAKPKVGLGMSMLGHKAASHHRSSLGSHKDSKSKGEEASKSRLSFDDEELGVGMPSKEKRKEKEKDKESKHKVSAKRSSQPVRAHGYHATLVLVFRSSALCFLSSFGCPLSHFLLSLFQFPCITHHYIITCTRPIGFSNPAHSHTPAIPPSQGSRTLLRSP